MAAPKLPAEPLFREIPPFSSRQKRYLLRRVTSAFVPVARLVPAKGAPWGTRTPNAKPAPRSQIALFP